MYNLRIWHSRDYTSLILLPIRARDSLEGPASVRVFQFVIKVYTDFSGKIVASEGKQMGAASITSKWLIIIKSRTIRK